VMRDLPQTAPPGSGGYGQTGWQPGWQGPMATRPADYRQDQGARPGSRGPFAVLAPLMGLVWVFVILGAVSLFGLGGGDRPLAIVLFLAALALFRRLFGFGRRRGMGRRGPRR
jgi:hypothetical protein